MLVVIVGGGAGVGAVQHLLSLLFTIDLTDNSSVQISGGRTTSGKGSSKKSNVTFLVQGDLLAGNPQFQYQKEKRQAANHDLSNRQFSFWY